MKKTLTILAAAALMFTTLAVAHEGHEHTVMGTVSAVDATHIEVHSTEGKDVSILFEDGTKFLQGDGAAGRGDVKTGERVAVRFVEEDGKNYAHEVRLPSKEK